MKPITVLLAEDHTSDGGAHRADPRTERLHLGEDGFRVETRGVQAARVQATCIQATWIQGAWIQAGGALLRRRHTERHRIPFFSARAITSGLRHDI